ncbi:MAG: hypothetical protein IJR85_02995 [Synergistaceae bacterium]|nr:hypothetical protein [Synergistaceae bacterium]
MKRLILPVIMLFCLCSPIVAEDSLPDTATLSANRMRFDAQTGDFLADGNVTIKAGELNVEAPVGSGNVDRREINFDEGITASGKWYGDKVDIKAGKLLLSFADVPTCKFQNGVKGGIGTMKLDADRLTITGTGGIADPSPSDNKTKFWLTKARNLEDTSRGLSFGADSVEGVIKDGELIDLTAKKGVWLKGRQKGKDGAVSLKGDNALYSLERGSVVVSGHVVAVQGGRTLRSDSIVYFPDQNRVEALGGLTKKTPSGGVSADRAEITIDLTRERKPKASPEPQPQTLQIPTEPKKEAQPEKKTPAPKTKRTRKK